MTPRKKNIRTLRDLNGGGGGGDDQRDDSSAYHKPITDSSSRSNSQQNQRDVSTIASKLDSFRVCHIPTLPAADAALAILQRVCNEFEPIVKRRGYQVKSVSEMYCCFDGLDFQDNGERSKGRKKKVMPHNVWGYNQTTFRGSYKAHTIHLRLRHPQSHDRFLLYEDVAGTMAHELAHCEIGPHNDAFNKLMEEILEEHMTLQAGGMTFGGGSGRVEASGGTAGAGGTPVFPGNGIALGGGGGGRIDPKHPGYKLGGDSSFSKWITPSEAACIAAEARRRQQKLRSRGQHCCQPCTITIPDDDDDADPIIEYHAPTASPNGSNDNEDDRKKSAAPATSKNARKAKSSPRANIENGDKKKKPKTVAASKTNETYIDLTEEEGDVGSIKKTESKLPAASWNDTTTVSSSAEDFSKEWACNRCTYINAAMALACSMCSAEKAP